MLEEKITFIGKVVEAIPVGCRVDVFGKSGFIPFSHLPYVSASMLCPQAEEISGGNCCWVDSVLFLCVIGVLRAIASCIPVSSVFNTCRVQAAILALSG